MGSLSHGVAGDKSVILNVLRLKRNVFPSVMAEIAWCRAEHTVPLLYSLIFEDD